MWPNGPAIACRAFTPPLASAGKNLNSFRPYCIPSISSDTVLIPGISGMVPSSVAAFSRDSVRPGLIANCAPASVTAFNCSTLVTVPAPTIASGTSLAIARIASRAHSVRRVTSSTRTPPATSAFAIGTACSSFFTTITGTTGPEVRIASAVVFQFFIQDFLSPDLEIKSS
ncbi:hypothetical protein [Klebsiella pneumoniae IS10]|nr:hypothetical protein [Klebsiella pneumoniae IS10]